MNNKNQKVLIVDSPNNGLFDDAGRFAAHPAAGHDLFFFEVTI